MLEILMTEREGTSWALNQLALQIAATDLPGVISALESLGGANTGRKLKM